MQRRPGLCLFCALATRVRPIFPQPASSLHTSAPWLRALNPSTIKAKKKSNRAKHERKLEKEAAKQGIDVATLKATLPTAPTPTANPVSFVRTSQRPRSPLYTRKAGEQGDGILSKERMLEYIKKRQDELKSVSQLETWGLTKQEKDKALESFYNWLCADGAGPTAQSKSELLPNEVAKDEERAILWEQITRSYNKGGIRRAMKNIELSFVGHVASQRAFSQNDFYNQKAMADLRYPIEWYPRTRATPRKIICHVGPTNSGKTYHALKRLEESGNGVYAGPLRLLAHEVYTRLNAKSLNCNLVTGEERRSPPAGDAGLLYACTVEMVPLNHEFEVAVLDEIQMIGDAHRGWAWTQALLGVQAKEIHVCGEERTVPLLREIAAMTGDSFEVNTYKRLTTLSMDTAPFGTDWSKLEKGDCIVTFTVKDIHLLRTRIEKQTKKKVAIVYGGLPPETRAAQARLFNDPDSGYDFLVASDAIGMGLNLSIKRIIFETTTKFNGVDMVPLTIPETKQIAGRAGRYRTAAQDNEAARKEKEGGANTSATPKNDSKAPKEEPSGGIVTAFRYQDFKRIAKCLQTDAEIIRAAGLFPPSSIIERFANYFPPGTPFSYIMVRLHDISRVHTRFRLCSLKDQLTIADVIHGVEGLSISDRITFTAAPANFKSPSDRTALISMAEFVAQQKDGSLLNIKGLPFDILDQEPDGSREYLFGLEQLHRGIILYLWLSYRFAGVFTTRNLAFHAKAVVEQAIEDTLVRFSTVAEYERRLQAKEARAQAREKTRQEFKERLQARKEEDARRGSEQLQEEGEGEEEEEREEEDYGREILDGADEGSVDILDGAEEGADIRPVKHEEQPVPIAADGAVEVKELDLKEGENEKRPEAEEDETEVDASALDNPLVEFDETEEDQVREEKEDGEQKEEKEAKGQ